MSWQATSWAKRTRGHRSVGDKLVLMILADYAHPETAEAYPSIHQLADDTEMSPRGVIYCLNSLEGKGFIRRAQRGNQYRPSVYRLNVDAPALTYEGAIPANAQTARSSESAVNDRVNMQSETSEGALPFTGGDKEETNEESTSYVGPRWLDILRQDPRWPETDTAFIRDIHQRYRHLDLEVEAHKCYDWLQTPKRQKPANPRKVWWNWLARAARNGGKRENAGKGQRDELAEIKKAAEEHRRRNGA